ncbi:MAG TPA: putative peptide maturation dehydrogenase [Arenimonas sp.]|uniref:putative peptide maturation dehydrogenase n=1 Tax=Arenimonas sp. TaxID=1872635 RepID=UPI002BCE2F51|nr:putative peptide maturation dehydrogenase [Arenimonas sp.]HMB57784.1 putative peptide maturation dehydrogenase [Arenimonas sp.]
MHLTRPSYFFLQRRERPEFSLEDLMSGGAGMVTRSEWVALAPHLGLEVVLEFADLAVFDVVTADKAHAYSELVENFGAERIARLLAAGLLLGDHAEHAELRARDQALRDTAWWGPAALAHTFSRWQGVDVQADAGRVGERTWKSMIDDHGLPPTEALQVRERESWHALPTPDKTAFDELLAARSTCRNFDNDFVLPLIDLSRVLHRVFAAQATQDFSPGAVALKKNSPSGGGLHPVEAFVLVQRVEGLAPGLYHYHSTAHVLEPMRLIAADALLPIANELVAGQSWFANAPVLLLMAARFQRSFWKYRNNSKAWRVIQLDAGHLSQNLYLSATEFGYGAFVTGAINDDCAERLFELDGLSTAAVAVSGFGRRATEIIATEFDPLGKAVR